jgi:hypothetical protein
MFCRAYNFRQSKQTSRFMFAGQTILARANKPAALCLQSKQFYPGQKYQPLYVLLQGKLCTPDRR